MGNGELKHGLEVNLITPQKLTQAKKVLPPVDDTRNDLLKAIRDGKCPFLEATIKKKFKQEMKSYSIHRHQTSESREDRTEGKRKIDRFPRCCFHFGASRCYRIVRVRGLGQ